MSEKRKLKCIKLAIKAGATPENAVRIAKDFENWVSEFSDPLKLDEQSPKVMDCYLPKWIGELRDPLKPDSKGSGEIDWSRPQLLASRTTNGKEFIVQSNGLHEDDVFYGTMKGLLSVASWKKSNFKYHGEIPQEQPTEENTTGLNFLEAVDDLRYNENYMYSPSQSVHLCVNDSMLQHFPNGSAHFYSPNLNHLHATDWQIINK